MRRGPRMKSAISEGVMLSLSRKHVKVKWVTIVQTRRLRGREERLPDVSWTLHLAPAMSHRIRCRAPSRSFVCSDEIDGRVP